MSWTILVVQSSNSLLRITHNFHCQLPQGIFYYFEIPPLGAVKVGLCQILHTVAVSIYVCMTDSSPGLSYRCKGVHREEGSADPPGDRDGLCGVKAVHWICLQQSQHQGHMWMRRELQHLSVTDPPSRRTIPAPNRVPSTKTERLNVDEEVRHKQMFCDVDVPPFLPLLFLQTTRVFTYIHTHTPLKPKYVHAHA